MSKPESSKIDTLVELIRPILAGQHEAIQSAVLADLLSMWLAGHIIAARLDTPAGQEKRREKLQEKLRDKLLRDHIKLVRDLIPLNEAMLLERTRRHSH